MNWSTHARMRWMQRAGGLDPDAELAEARRPSKRLRRVLDESCNRVAASDRDYLVSPSGMVFVIGDATVVTVFSACEAKRRQREARTSQREIARSLLVRAGG
jgi:hypothetical protein